jgi:hypothetical protein
MLQNMKKQRDKILELEAANTALRHKIVHMKSNSPLLQEAAEVNIFKQDIFANTIFARN